MQGAYFNNMKYDEKLFKELAKESVIKHYQDKFNGSVETFLYPNYDILWRINYVDVSFPERNGVYVCTGIEISLNDTGFHRKARLAYLYTTADVNDRSPKFDDMTNVILGTQTGR
jgi:hypothetical protein